MNMTIHNQCSNIELVSPVYFIKDLARNIQFPQQVNSKSMMKTNFITSADQNTFGGALLYHLRRKEDASISAQLLVIWGRRSDKFYLHMCLIEHESAPTWSKNKLEKLYNIYNSQCNIGFNTGKWWFNDNTKLKTNWKSSLGGFEMEIIISEEKDTRYSIKPLWIDSNR
jgi:hypothetical protein